MKMRTYVKAMKYGKEKYAELYFINKKTQIMNIWTKVKVIIMLRKF